MVIVIRNNSNFAVIAIAIERKEMKVIVIDGQVLDNSLLLLYYTFLFSLDYSHHPMPLISENIFNYY